MPARMVRHFSRRSLPKSVSVRARSTSRSTARLNPSTALTTSASMIIPRATTLPSGGMGKLVCPWSSREDADTGKTFRSYPCHPKTRIRSLFPEQRKQFIHSAVPVPLRARGDDPRRFAVRARPLPNLDHCRPRPGPVRLVHHHDVRHVEHRDLLELEPAAVLRAHDQHRPGNEVLVEGHGLLPNPDGFHDDQVESD